ncbi:MAG: DUF433 domain-containing protein [Thermodesulfovibrionales bacterium]|jgi:uncharacterized protein (DUF433 family)|nr:DUF433 domain-containing protein [Thermodesulfovibrionales bacterium]
MLAELKTEHPYIIKNPEICGGSPVISGTRITVRLIASMVKSGRSAEDILRGYPHLTFAQIHDAISYYFDHKSEIEQEIQENTLRAIMKRYNMRLVVGEYGIDRLVTEEEFEKLSEDEKEKTYTWETLPEKYK